MYIFNVTYSIELSIEGEWLKWFKEELIHTYLESGKFSHARLTKVLSHRQPDSENYSLQLLCENTAILQEFLNQELPLIEKKILQKYADKVLMFTTELELVEDFFNNAN